MAVQRVGLAPRRPAAARAGGVHEVLALGQRVAGRRWATRSQGQQHRQLLSGHRHRAAVRARSRRSGSAFPTSAGARSRSRWRGSASPGAGRDRRGLPRSSALLGRSVPAYLPGSRSGSPRRARPRQSQPPAISASVRSRAGIPSTAVAPKRPSTTGETSTGSGSPRRLARGQCAHACRSAGSSRRRARRAPSRPSAGPPDARAHRRGRAQRSTSGWRGEISTNRASATASSWGVNTVSAVAVRRPAGRARPRRRARARSAGWRARSHPRSSVRELLQAAVVLLQVGADAQIPLRALDQAHGVVAAPASPAVLDLDRGEGRLAGVAPVDGARAAVDQARVEQRQEQPLRPAIHERVGAEERAVPVERVAQALAAGRSCARRSARPTRWGTRRARSRPARRAARRRRSRTRTAPPRRARATKARIGVADRVGADVADVDVARGERRRGLDVAARAQLARSPSVDGCGERVARAPGGLPARLDRVRVIAGGASERPVAHSDRAYPRASAPQRPLLCSQPLGRLHRQGSRGAAPLPIWPRRVRGLLVRAD